LKFVAQRDGHRRAILIAQRRPFFQQPGLSHPKLLPNRIVEGERSTRLSSSGKVKVPAAWLIERPVFRRLHESQFGFRRNTHWHHQSGDATADEVLALVMKSE